MLLYILKTHVAMKKTLILLLTLFPLMAYSQVVITNATFPTPGDTYPIAQDADTQPFTVTPAGMNQVWDYTSLNADLVRQDTFVTAMGDPVAVANFPSADIIVPYVQGTLTFYADIQSSRVEAVGSSLNLLGFNLPLALEKPYVLRHAPISYGYSDVDTAYYGLKLAVSDIPGLDTILQDLVPIPFATLDSFKVRLIIRSNVVADAYGKLTLPNMLTTDVLRTQRTDALDYGVQVHVVTLFGDFWFDVPALPEIPIPTETITYEYRDNTHGDPLLSATVLPVVNTVGTVSFHYQAPAVGINLESLSVAIASPNPTANYISLPDGSGFGIRQINNAAGQMLAIFPSQTQQISVADYPNGIYWLQLENAQGKVQTQKIIVQH